MRHIKKLNTIEFDGLGELGRHIRNMKEKGSLDKFCMEIDHRFYGKKTFEQQLACSAFGDLSVVESAQRLLDKIQTEINVPASTWADDVAGFFPCVPEALSGEPECMRCTENQENNTAPLNIFVDISTSASISPSSVMRRGITILALVMAMTAVRPVNLRVCTISGCKTKGSAQRSGDRWCAVTAVIDTQPLDLARAAWALTDVGCARRLFYGVGFQLGFDGGWPVLSGVKYGEMQSAAGVGRCKEIFSQGSDTLFIPAISLFDKESDEMIMHPTQWVNKKIEQFRA